jgi:ubiquitin-conjugating enzyme E2 R
MAQSPTASATRALQQELKNILKEPVEGFLVDVPDGNFFEWDVRIFGPPGTLYESGYFKVSNS